MDQFAIAILFFFVATLYASVGFGGGSSYLAILSLLLVDFYEIRSTALMLNLAVVSISTFFFIRRKVFEWKLFWPFLLASIPLAYLGATLPISEKVFFFVLGAALIVSALLMLLKVVRQHYPSLHFSFAQKLTVGGITGLVSGLSGIGGGIFLSPVLHVAGWKDVRKIAAVSALFIFMNSLAGITGLIVYNSFRIDTSLLLILLVAVGSGATVGSYLAHWKFKKTWIILLTAMVVLYVGCKLIYVQLYY